MDFLEALQSMTVKDLVAQIMVIVTILSIIIEKSKKLPFNPWSKLFAWIGTKANEPVNHRLDIIERTQTERLNAIEENYEKTKELIGEMRTEYKTSMKEMRDNYNTRIDKLERDADEKEVKRLRSNMICFADSCRTGNNNYTKQHFENIFRDYDDYLKYCKQHDFQNHFIDSEMAYIKNVYTQLSANNFAMGKIDNN